LSVGKRHILRYDEQHSIGHLRLFYQTVEKSKRASEVVDLIFDTISTFGCMETIIADQGREFVNSMNDKLCNLLDVKHKLTSPYHPQGNG
jgi:RecA-family ATPase